MFNRMCLGTLIVLYPVNSLLFKLVFLLNSMALIVKISNSWVYGIPTETFSVTFFSGSTPIFGPSSLDGKGTTKPPMLVDKKVSMSGDK